MSAGTTNTTEIVVNVMFAAGCLMLGFFMGECSGKRSLCSDLAGKSARYIEGRCYVASPDGSLVPARGAK